MSGSPSNSDLEERMMQHISRYQNAASYDEKKSSFEQILTMAKGDYVGACYVVGSCMLGTGPCGDGFLEPNRERAARYLKRAHELGDPIAQALLDQHRLS